MASTIAYSQVGPSETTSKSCWKIESFSQSRRRLSTPFQLPNQAEKSRQRLPVGTIHSTASRNSWPFPLVRAGSLSLPGQCGYILAHRAAINTNRSIQSLNHKPRRDGILNLNRVKVTRVIAPRESRPCCARAARFRPADRRSTHTTEWQPASRRPAPPPTQ